MSSQYVDSCRGKEFSNKNLIYENWPSIKEQECIEKAVFHQYVSRLFGSVGQIVHLESPSLFFGGRPRLTTSEVDAARVRS